MILFSKPTKVVSVEGNKGVFELEALYPGYGVTVGNSLRRVLLSSLEGAAVTQVKIKGASHEFATLPGVKEDVIGILLNLKQLRFQMFADEPQKATIKIKGEKEVKASDLSASSQVEVVNKDLVVAHVTDKTAVLEMELQIGKGTGYEGAETRKGGKQEIGTISLDAIYTPVRRVSYRVEQMRVGERTDFDRLVLEVETDGTMHPETALKRAAEILVKQFQIVEEGLQEQELTAKEAKKAPAKKMEAKKPAEKKKPTTKKK